MRSLIPALALASAFFISGPASAQLQGEACDVDVDGDIDISDIGLILAARNTPASGPDDPRDVDGDGFITVLDARQCVLRCTLPGCEEPQSNEAPSITSAPVTTATVGELYTYDVEAVDPDGDTLTFSLDTAPTGMSIDPASGLVQWTPAATQAGTNAVGVRATDPGGLFASQAFTVLVEVGNEAPNIVSVPVTTGTVGELYTYDVEAVDPDGDTLTFSLDTAPAGMSIDPASGLVQWTPAATQAGTNAVGVRATDPGGLFASQAFTVLVEVGNEAPNIVSVPVTTGTVGELYTYDVEAVDPDGDTLTFSLDTAPTGMSIDPASGLVQWTPAATQAGTNAVGVRATDPGGLFASQAFTVLVEVGNEAPNIVSVPVTTGTVGELYTYDVEAVDPDGDTLTFSLDTAPAGMSIDPASGLVQWTPAATQAGTNAVGVRATDPGGLFASQAFTVLVEVGNEAPNIVSVPVTTGTVGELYTYDVEAVDPDGDTLTFSLDTAPAGMSIDPASGLVQWTPAATQAGTNAVGVRATDPGGLFASQAFTVLVEDVPADDFLRPVVTLQLVPADVVNVDDVVTIQVTATDDTAVTGTALTIDGATLPLDGTGTATFSSAVPGVFGVVATAFDAAGNEGSASATLRVLQPGDTAPPTAAIDLPVDDSEITAPVDVVGTANDDTAILQYRLELAPAGTLQFFTIASGNTPVTGGVLGELDPSRLQNGTYTLRLVAEDTAGNTASDSRVVQLDGDLKVGNFSLTITDLEVPVVGQPITINRSYDSRRQVPGDFGFGWDLELSDIRINENGLLGEGWQQVSSGGFFPSFSVVPTRAHTVTLTFPNDRTERFTFDVISPPSVLFPYTLTIPVDGAFFAAPGSAGAALTSLPAPLALPVLGGSTGPVELLDDIIGNTFDPGRYLYADRSGNEFRINQVSGLEAVTDRNGNTVTFGPGGIIHSAGTSVPFARDAQGRITSITDPQGNVLTYEYDAYGDLVATTDQEGNTTRYRYNSTHGLLEIIDPLGRGVARNEYDDEGRLVATVDADGNRIEYSHDLAARQEVVTDRNGNVTVFGYDNFGNVTTQTDALGNTTSFTYDASGNQLSSTDPLGNTKIRSYDAQDNVLSETDPLGAVTTFTYNAQGDPLTITDPRGNVYTRSYDANGNLLTENDALGNVTANAYDAGGNVLSTTDALGNVTTFTYDAAGNESSVTDALGNVTTFTYDANGNQLSETRSRTLPDGSTETLTTLREYDSLNRPIREIDALGGVRETFYDANGNVVAEFDKLGRVLNHTYNARGNRTQTTYPDSTTQTFVYDPENRLISSTDRLGRSTALEYDALGRLVRSTYPDGSAVTTAYDAAGRRSSSTDERGNNTTYEYDAAGQVTRITDALGATTTFQYDAAGNQTRAIDARGNSTDFVYDAGDRLVETIFADGNTAVVTYDAIGRRIAETDQLGQVTTFAYDAMGRLTSTTDALGNVTSFTYDEVGNKLTQIDANGNTESWTYDALGRVLTHTLPLGQVESFSYDLVGNVLTHEDFNGDTTAFEYDVNNRVTRKTFEDLTSESYTYTAAGLLATLTDARGVTTYTYDTRDRLLEKILPNGETLSYTYDAAGNRTATTTPAGTTAFAFDALNRLLTVTDAGGGVTTHSYDATGNRIGLVYPNGNETAYTYDALNRLVNLVNAGAGGSTLSSYAYTLAPDGKRTRVVEADGRQVDYAYDAVNRLVSEVTTDPGPTTTTVTYSYDAVGNRLTRVADGVTTVHTYDANDRLLTDDTSNYAYDDNGNLLTRTSGAAVTTYAYDFENQLVATVTPSDSVQYQYDELGNRVSRNVNGTLSRFLVDTNRQLSRVLAELDAAGAPLAGYTVGDDLIAQQRAANESFYLYDGNGSTRQLSNAAGAVTDDYDFDAFGNLLASTGTTSNEFLYSGEQLDANLGFYYLRARYMDPSVGRFVSRDPFPGNSFDPRSLHKYSYALNDPINVSDPTGRFGIASVGVSFSVRSILISAAISFPFRALEAALDLSEGASLGAVTLNLVTGVGFDVAVGGAIGNLFRFARSFVSIRAASQSVSAFRAARASGSVWNKAPFARGWDIETKILGNRWLAPNFPVIDDWVRSSRVVTSIKSLDLTASSYQTASRLRSAVTRSARSLANFRGASLKGVTIAEGDIGKRVLVYAFEQGAATRQQARVLRELAKELKQNLDIELVFQWIP